MWMRLILCRRLWRLEMGEDLPLFRVIGVLHPRKLHRESATHWNHKCKWIMIQDNREVNHNLSDWQGPDTNPQPCIVRLRPHNPPKTTVSLFSSHKDHIISNLSMMVLVMESIQKNFFPHKPDSKRVNSMKNHAKLLAQSQNFVQLTIDLPY